MEIGYVVDEQDHVIRTAPRPEIVEQNLLHRSGAVVVRNPDGRILVHQRPTTLRLYPGLFDVKFGGLLQAGETYEQGAIRELAEEAGISGVTIKPLGIYRHKDEQNNVLSHVYITTYSGPYTIQKEEVALARWMSLAEIKILADQDSLTPTAKEVFALL